ncbi:MAG: putative 26S proteasome regulatory subunit [Heterodermia speciosa]|uniref:Probable 26S proteasome regulatory subunit p27 n=1 Tax=Heterodermia speciosa TaxID=116794 RepID=A0A8H3EUL0_9LECA|nr:MAG: putative 26S proteasome regulatory subunit [Heterodermia speciosa]
MGLHMDNIHTPSVPSAPTSSSHPPKSSDADKTPLLDLIADKDRVEGELKALMGVLQSHNANMTTPLTTFDGFPRSDLDVAQIRTTRARIIRLRNDYKALMSRIETGLHAHHASIQASALSAAPSSTSSVPGSSNQPTEGQANVIETPFAKVNSVVEGSPAHTAGLRAGDRIRTFGAANWMNHEKLTKVADVVRRSEGRNVLVKIIRGEEPEQKQELRLQLTPKRDWGGRGLLGCHLLPI